MTNAHIFDQKAMGLAADYLRTEGLLLTLLMEMRRQRLFTPLNYSGIFDYCERRLKLSCAQAYYFKTVAEKAEHVPEIKEAIVHGELTLSQARRIAPVITSENHAQWIEKAKTLPQRELEREVTAINPKAHIQEKIRPMAKEVSELKVPVDPKTEANLVALREILSQKLGRPATLAQVVAWAAEVTRGTFDPIRRAERSLQISSRKPTAVPTPGRQPVRASVRNPVVLRDGMQCTFTSPDGRRCAQKRWLQLHHKVEVRNGGLNTVENLHTLCYAHHRLVHANREAVLSK